MSLRVQILAALAAIFVMVSILVLLVALWKELLFSVARFLGVFNANSLLFFLGFIFVMIYLVHLSVKVSILTENSKEYSQHIGLLKAELEDIRKGEAA
jgi:hypothetical protein